MLKDFCYKGVKNQCCLKFRQVCKGGSDMDNQVIGYNIRLWRKQKQLTQAQLADIASISVQAIKKIESGQTMPRSNTLRSISKALNVKIHELIRPVPELQAIRFRSCRMKNSVREFVIADIARRLEDYTFLEKILDRSIPSHVGELRTLCSKSDLSGSAERVRDTLGFQLEFPILDIRNYLEAAGIKVLTIEFSVDNFFGLSIGEEDGGPAIVVNVSKNITVERQIFSSVHELAHLLLHPAAYNILLLEEKKREEAEADEFAGYFLMPDAAFREAWEDSAGLLGLERVLKVKSLFGVSYKTVLYRLIKLGVTDQSVWKNFSLLFESKFKRKLGYCEEPFALNPFLFSGERLQGLVREALEKDEISLDRGAEILRISFEEMRDLCRSWKAVI